MARKMKKKRSFLARWKPGKEEELQPNQEEAFLIMHERKMRRELNGRHKKSSKFGFIAFLLFVLVIYGTAATYEDDPTSAVFTLNVLQVVALGLWGLLSVFITAVFGKGIYAELMNWIFIYWPLLGILASVLLTGERNPFNSSSWIWATMLIGQVLTVFVWMLIYLISPRFVRSQFFSTYIGASYYWNTHLVDDWTVTYQNILEFCGTRHTCKYRGEVNETGLPHGTGSWSDDSYYGEVITGQWSNGNPVAPFLSRQYGTGDSFRAVPLAVFIATDDDFESNKFKPKNDIEPRCAVVSVECSINGSFYSNLPRATLLCGPHVLKEEATISDCFKKLRRLETVRDDETQITISTDEELGLQVENHFYEPTGSASTKETQSIVVDVRERSLEVSASVVKVPRFMPRGISAREKIFVTVDEDYETVPLSPSAHSDPTFSRLEIRDWTKTTQRDALVYIAGFNSTVRNSSECLGQFVAMTDLSKKVCPILFAFPCGQVLSYHLASAASASKRNKDMFREMLEGIKAAGVRNVHLMSHSLGVQTLLGVFEEELDGARSAVSKCFHLASDFNDDSAGDDSLLRCKSITMLNPDFPLEAFVDHAYKSVRRVCKHVTVVGDLGDQALFWSQTVNGAFRWLGFKQPRVLQNWSKKDEPPGLRPQRVIGRCINYLYLQTRQLNSSDDEEPLSNELDERLLFRDTPPVVLSATEELERKAWLDVDVIDTTSLDTNMQNLRHSAFNVNPILMKDLEELLLTGRRANKRSTLLYREGNVYSYCHAPSFVTL